MKKLLEDVAAFHKATRNPVRGYLYILDKDRFVFRSHLIEEEMLEFADASDAYVNMPDTANIPAIAQEMVDLIYVLVGLALEMGIPLDKVWDEVQTANMRKVDPSTGKVRYREDGKVLKPKDWKEPDIKKAVFGG